MSPATVNSDICRLVSQNTSSFHPRLRQNLCLQVQKRRRTLLAPAWWVLGLVAPWPYLDITTGMAEMRGLWGWCLLPTILLHTRVRQPLGWPYPPLHTGGSSITTAQNRQRVTFASTRLPVLPHPASPTLC